ncbi:MAG: hypothetical protein HY843_07650 [Bdellovibrio sp.]|nr:hypothetical protein [Bdellovibrio sp.]
MTSRTPTDWGEVSSQVSLTPEQIIEWLESYRELMIEVWKNNPELRKQWEQNYC